MTIDAECSSCNGTGIYHGFAEPPGVGVVCFNCNGRGNMKIMYKPFIGIKRRNDIKTVQESRGNFLATGVGPVGKSISYEEFFISKIFTEKQQRK